MYTVGQVAQALNVSDSTIRQWSGEFADHLSEEANPPKGETRRYDDGDVAALQTVAILRDQLVDYADIHERLAAGERLEPAPEERIRPEEPAAADTALITESFAEALRNADSRIATLTDRLIDAEKRAAAAETRAEMLQAQLDERKGEKEGADGRPWWRFWSR